MEHANPHRSPRAWTAIAAALVLPATIAAAPAFAQDAAPSLDLPQDIAPVVQAPPPPAASSAPVVTLPLQAPQQPTVVLPAAPPPPAEPAPQASAKAAAPSAKAPTRAVKQTETRNVQSAASALAQAQQTAEPAAPIVPTATPSSAAREATLAQGPSPLSAPAATTPPPAAPRDDDGLPTAGIVGLLAALGIAGAGIVAMRSRRRTPVARTEPARELRADPVPAPAAFAEPMAPTPAPQQPAPVTPRQPTAGMAGAMAGEGAGAVLAAAPLPTEPEERRELLERMAAAPPDASNPFKSFRARMRRARIQLQHRSHLESKGTAFDWRTYKPAAKPSAPVNPELVTA